MVKNIFKTNIKFIELPKTFYRKEIITIVRTIQIYKYQYLIVNYIMYVSFSVRPRRLLFLDLKGSDSY